METSLPIRRRASQHPRRANRSPRGTRPSCTLTARPCAARQKAATTPLTNHKKNPQPRFNRNQQYSITAVSDGGGSVVERYAYSAYGQVTIADASGTEISDSAIANRYTYTGREWDEALSLYHYRARMYDAVAGRFVSRDPIGNTGSKWNLYQFVGSRTLTYWDPSGLYGPMPGYGPGWGGTQVLDTSQSPGDFWDLPEFVLHYWIGGGTPFDVDPEDMETFVQGAPSAMALARALARSSGYGTLNDGCGKSTTTAGYEEIVFGLDHPRSSVGAVFDDRAILNSGVMKVAWSCTVSSTCCPNSDLANSLSVSCSINMMYTDRFANPTDVKDPYYETPRDKLAACIKDCRERHGGPRPRGGSPFTNCVTHCRHIYPESELPFATAFPIRGFHSTSISENYKFECCD